MKPHRVLVKALTPVVSILLLFVGVTCLRAQLWTVGTVCLLLALAGFVYSMRLLEKSPLTSEELAALRPLLPVVLIWLAIISLSFIAVFYVADNAKSAETDRIAALAFVASVLLGLAAVWWKSLRAWKPASLLEKIKNNRLETGLVVGILLLAFALRTIALTSHPYPWSGDEASIGMEAIRILRGEITNYFETGWSSQPNWSFLPTAVTEILLGKDILAVRMASALAGTLAVLFVYLFGREMFNPAIGLMAGTFLATMPYHLHFSRVGVANVVDSLVSSMMFWLIARGINRDDARYYYTAGAVAGLSIYTYAGTRLVLVLAGLTFLFLILRQKGYLASHWPHLFAFAGGTLISAAPQAAFFARHPDIFMGRFGQEGIFLNGWLAGQVAAGQSVGQIILNQFSRTFLVYIASAAPGNFFNSPEPYLTILGSILFLLGMAYALAHLLEPRYFILLIWFWVVILFGGVLTLNPPANTRLLMTTPAVALLLAVGANQILEYLQKFNLMSQRVFAPALVVLTLILVYQNVNYYMFTYRSRMYFQDANGELAMEVGHMARSLGSEYQIFILGEPRIFAGFPTLAFIAPENPRADLGASMVGTFALAPGQKSAFFAIPENQTWIDEISQRYPGGERGTVYRKPRPDEILFRYYILGN